MEPTTHLTDSSSEAESEFRLHVQEHVDRLQGSVECLTSRLQAVETDLSQNTMITASLSGKIDAMHRENTQRMSEHREQMDSLRDDVEPVLHFVRALHTSGMAIDRSTGFLAKVGKAFFLIVGVLVFVKVLLTQWSLAAAIAAFNQFLK